MSAAAGVRSPAHRPRTAMLLAGSVLVGVLAGRLIALDHAVAVLGLAVVLVPVLLWRAPWLAAAMLATAALTVEQFPPAPVDPAALALGAPPAPPAPVTSSIPLFHGIGSLHLSPADLLLLGVGIAFLAHRGRDAGAAVRHSALRPALVAVLAAAALGIAVGVMHHGQLRVALMELRPFVYLGGSYLLASRLTTSRDAVRAVLWAIVLGTGVKALQALYLFVSIRHMRPRPEAVLGHEEALLFALLVFLALMLWLYDVRGPLRTAATCLLPLVMVANLVNHRRAAWLILAGGLLAAAAIGLRALPARRLFLTRVLAGVLAASAIYVPAMWNRTGALAQPARALHSAIAPDARDASSDLYRIQEDANLKINIREGGLLGRGFGVPIDYELPITDISALDAMIAFVPHNGVLYIPMRMGLLGAVAFWSLLGAAILVGCRLSRAHDRELAVVGALLVCATFGYALMGGIDQGFFLYRIAFVMGVLLGVAEAATRIVAREART